MTGSERGQRRPLSRRIRDWDIWSTARALRSYVLFLEALVIPLALVLPALRQVLPS